MSVTLERAHPSPSPKLDPIPVAAQRRAAAAARDLKDLFLRRPDLAGVHAAADVAADAVTWTA